VQSLIINSQTQSYKMRCKYTPYSLEHSPLLHYSQKFYSITLKMSAEDNCIWCKQPVRARQQGLLCDCCERWQHRTCNSGISLIAYRTAVRCGEDIDWRCEDCRNLSAGFLLPAAESTRLVQEREYSNSYSHTEIVERAFNKHPDDIKMVNNFIICSRTRRSR
jgi:predicted RNA-binding Zn-ribbon protein involved in translation (DUF1610 family)